MRLRLTAVFAALFLLSASTAPVRSAGYVAFSLKQAASHGRANSIEADQLGGITEPVGYVYDSANDDYLLVGIANPQQPPLRLETFFVALKSTMRKDLPTVSIDPPVTGGDPRQQPVRFRGQLEDTRLGLEMLDADIALKRLALGMIHADVWGVRSYLALSADQARKSGELPSLSSRFWLMAGDTRVSGGERDGAMVVQSCKLRVETEVLTASQSKQDPIGENFASQIAASFPDLVLQYPALARVLPILRLVALAEGITRHHKGSSLDYLNQYKIPNVPTPRTYELAEARENVPEISRAVVLTGGLEANPLLIGLNSGDATAFREIVVSSRPSPSSLVWRLPLDSWDYTGEDAVTTSSPGSSSPNGFSIFRSLDNIRPSTLINSTGPLPVQAPVPSPPVKPQALNNPFFDSPQQRAFTFNPPQFPRPANVGGVMLRATADVSGTNSPQDLVSGNFALVVNGDNTRPSEETLRKFVTALWAVYFCDQDPGISIDPISPDSDKHLVRYIGNVLNTDLGRVMREADYLMKKWAVGTERANIPGFKNPDDFIAKMGLHAFAYSRFWFVPEDMTFKRAGDMLLFASGRMTVKTEYLSQGLSQHSEPANEKFAELFTNQYDLIARQYPVYRELFEYAKLVSLAKYLKNSGVPLTWYLMAHKDLVITEDSPGTVDALAHGSNYYRNLSLKGGVNLKTEGRYVYDATATAAIQDAMAHSRTNGAAPRTTLTSVPSPASPEPANQPFSFGVGKDSYSVVPQYSLVTGKDKWGNRYQTDIALRNGSKPGLELVRYFDSRRPQQTEFGSGWRVMVPYRIKPFDNEKMEFLNARIPVKMTVENLLTGRDEVLTFSKDRYSIAGYVPDKLSGSQVVGLFITTSASYRLADKFGNEFWFDPEGTMTDMTFGDQDRVHYQYLETATNAFEHAPYEIRPDGSETIEYRGEVLPKRIIVRESRDSANEKLAFDLTQDVATYFPVDENSSRYRKLLWRPEVGYRLQDKHGNVAGFKNNRQFEALLPSLDSPVMRSMSMGKQKIDLSYALDSSGRLVIAKAALTTGDDHQPEMAVRYEYNQDGTLGGTRRFEPEPKLAMNRPIGR